MGRVRVAGIGDVFGCSAKFHRQRGFGDHRAGDAGNAPHAKHAIGRGVGDEARGPEQGEELYGDPAMLRNYRDEATTVATTAQPDGTTVITGSIRAGVPASDGEDRCVRPLVEMVVGPDLVTRSSRWIETCPGRGTREYRATATYGPQVIQPPTRPRLAASDVLG